MSTHHALGMNGPNCSAVQLNGTASNNNLIERICDGDVGIDIGWAPVPGRCPSVAEANATAVPVGRIPLVGAGSEAEVLDTSCGSEVRCSGIASAGPSAEAECTRGGGEEDDGKEE